MTMIEQVSRGMAAKAAERLGADADFAKDYPGGVAQYVDTQWHLFADFARAGIEAMQRPTRAMVEAGQGASDAITGWPLMVGAALAEPAPVTVLSLG